MRLLVDLNVVLDVLLDRAPHAPASAELWRAIEEREAEGLLSAHAVTTLHYLAVRARGKSFGEQCVRDVLTVFAIAAVDGPVIEHALGLGFVDFEDAVCVAAAIAAGCDAIVSRDAVGFRAAPLPVLDPAGAAGALRVSRGNA